MVKRKVKINYLHLEEDEVKFREEFSDCKCCWNSSRNICKSFNEQKFSVVFKIK